MSDDRALSPVHESALNPSDERAPNLPKGIVELAVASDLIPPSAAAAARTGGAGG